MSPKTIPTKKEQDAFYQLRGVVQKAAPHPVATAVVGIDLGDKSSSCCTIDQEGQDLGEGTVATTDCGMRTAFAGKARMRIAIECGTHSPWVSRLLAKKRAVVAVARKLLILMHKLWRTQTAFVSFPQVPQVLQAA